MYTLCDWMFSPHIIKFIEIPRLRVPIFKTTGVIKLKFDQQNVQNKVE